MATVNYSVPDAVKQAFDATFSGQNKSAVIARLMREAVEERQRQERRAEAIDALLRVRRRAKPVSARAAATARRKGRP